MIITSLISRWAAYNIEIQNFKIPRFLKKGGLLIGAAVGDIQPSELIGFRSDMRSTGPIYGDIIF
jgi:hypothetical protein